MNIKDIKYDWELMAIVRKSVMPERYCPECKGEMPMAQFRIAIPGSLRNTLFGKSLDTAKRFRCMGCLTLWDEYEGRVEEKK